MTTPEQAKQFLSACRNKSKKEEWEHRPSTSLSSAGVDAWYMMQRHREQELRQRRREAEQLLHGWNGDLGAWSPRARRGRASFGGLSDSLTDPNECLEKRRQSTMPRLQHNWGEEDGDRGSYGGADLREVTPLGPERSKFLLDRQYYDGTQYPKFDERTAFENGRELFKENGFQDDDMEQREPGATFNPARYIDTTESQNRLLQAGGRRKSEGASRYSNDSVGEFEAGHYRPSVDSERESMNVREAPADTQLADIDEEVPETIWRDFISDGKYNQYTQNSSFAFFLLLTIFFQNLEQSSHPRLDVITCMHHTPALDLTGLLSSAP